MKKLLFFLLAVFCSCSSQPIRGKLMDKISRDFAKQTYWNRKLILAGSGGGAFYDVTNFSFTFFSFEKIETPNLERAREELISVSEELLEMINTDEKIRPYLHNYPFDSENIEILIMFVDKSDPLKSLDLPFLSGMYVVNGKAVYLYNDRANDKLVRVHQESYEEAKRLVEEATGCF